MTVVNMYIYPPLSEDELSMAGLVIKVQVLAAWDKVEPFYKGLNLEGHKWSMQMSAAIMRQANKQS